MISEISETEFGRIRGSIDPATNFPGKTQKDELHTEIALGKIGELRRVAERLTGVGKLESQQSKKLLVVENAARDMRLQPRPVVIKDKYAEAFNNYRNKRLSPLNCAIEAGNWQAVEVLMQNKIALNTPQRMHESNQQYFAPALTRLAVKYPTNPEALRLIRKMILSGADLKVEIKHVPGPSKPDTGIVTVGNALLITALTSDHLNEMWLELAQLLLSRGIDPNFSYGKSQWRLIQYANQYPNDKKTQLLLKHGARVDIPNYVLKKELPLSPLSSSLASRESTNSTPASVPERMAVKVQINPDELSRLVKLPFNGYSGSPHSKGAFNIRDTNSKGEAVGEAFFSDKGIMISVAWFWSPITGFDVIASKELFISHRADIQTCFSQDSRECSFIGLKINEKGVVAGAAHFGKMPIQNKKTGHFIFNPKYVWYWWSKNQGLHVSSLKNYTTLIADIDDHGNVQLQVYNRFKTPMCAITNIRDMDKFKIYSLFGVFYEDPSSLFI